MRKLDYLRRAIVVSAFGTVLTLGAAFSVNAQNETREYREWQNAQARAEREHQDYLRTRSPWDYQQWQNAQRVAQEQYRQYQVTSNRYGNNNNYRDGNRNNDYRDNNRGTFRINRNGVYYSTDSRGAELLRTAVRNGYGQGYTQGQMDKRNRRPFDYTMGQMYRNGNYGYQSYVARDQYQYYFQQGFQRGYEDGFNSTYRYGSRNGNAFTILGSVLDSIIDISH